MKAVKYFLMIKETINDWSVISDEKHELNYKIIFDKEDESVILAFQESKVDDGKSWINSKDWKDNLNFWPKPCKVYKNQVNHLICHRGFVEEYKVGNDKIMNEIINFFREKKAKKIIIIGWSNGAAEALLAAEDLYFRTTIRPEVVTFGSPKLCFDKHTSKVINNCCENVVEYCNKNDIVTKLPPFFWHVRKVKIGKKKLFGIFKPSIFHTNYDQEIADFLNN